MTREIVLDTETTGLDPRSGHRIVEIALVEIEDCVPTGRTFHRYIDPERPIEAEAERVHGISNDFVAGKPTFAAPEVAEAMLAFIGSADLVAHNAAFDRAFLEAELERAGLEAPAEERWVDSLALAQRRYPGMYNSLDALCRRFRISLADRSRHGALVDAQLLAQVYLELRGGRERRLDLGEAGAAAAAAIVRLTHGPRPRPLASRLTEAEAATHLAFVRAELGPAPLWLGVIFGIDKDTRQALGF